MTQEGKKQCPTCNGKKVIGGVCECSTEWRGTQKEDEWEDCQCTPEEECPNCGGAGYVDAD